MFWIEMKVEGSWVRLGGTFGGDEAAIRIGQFQDCYTSFSVAKRKDSGRVCNRQFRMVPATRGLQR